MLACQSEDDFAMIGPESFDGPTALESIRIVSGCASSPLLVM
jgi:hypothetical protein